MRSEIEINPIEISGCVVSAMHNNEEADFYLLTHHAKEYLNGDCSLKACVSPIGMKAGKMSYEVIAVINEDGLLNY